MGVEGMSELAIALAKAQAEMKAAAFDKVNPHFGSRYATLASVIDAVREPLTKNGIAFVQRVVQVENGVGIETVFIGHGDKIETGALVVPVDKKTAQGMGSALTYARRYSLSMACCISSDEDDDGNAAEKSAPKKGTRVIDAALEGVKIDEKERDAYVHAITAALISEDMTLLDETLDELTDQEMKMAVWSKLDSKDRSFIKKHQAERRESERAA